MVETIKKPSITRGEDFRGSNLLRFDFSRYTEDITPETTPSRKSTSIRKNSTK